MNTGKTIVEKIFAAKAGREVEAGDLVVVPVDFAMGQDTKTPLAIEILRQSGLPVRIDRQRIALVIDHRVPPKAEIHANQHMAMRRFADEEGMLLYDAGSGIGHLLALEEGHIWPGYLAVGTDSHSTTYGAINAAGIAVGSSEMAAILATGRLWFRVPATIRVELSGSLLPGVYAKDVILHLIGRFGEAGANYHAVEYAGSGVAAMSMDGRFTLCNMTTDMGGKTAIMEVDQVTRDWLASRVDDAWEPISPDPDARYAQQHTIDVSALLPQVAVPHSVERVAPVTEVVGTRINQASIGSCANSRFEDLQVAANIVAGKRVARGVRFYVAAGSREVYRRAMREGVLEVLSGAGVMILPPSCATCAGGVASAIPGDGEVAISAANRNFRGRLGNKKSFIYLASPATVAASAIEGVIADPREYV